MKKLGNGLQYVAYNAGGGRVFKRTTTKKEKIIKLKSWNLKTPSAIAKKIKGVNEHGRFSINTVKELIKNQSIPVALIGNPKFQSRFNYTQDKVTPIRDYLKTHNLRQNKKILKNYVLLEHTLWQYGISDDARKPTVNNGVTKDGSVILMDFGECTFKKRKVATDIKNNNWLSKYSLRGLVDQRLRDFMFSLVAKEITLEKLNHFWNIKRNT